MLRSKSWFKVFGFILILAGFLVAIKLFPVQEYLRDLLNWIAGLGMIGGAVFVAVYILAAVFFLPGSLLTLGAGAVFGVVKGSLIVSFSATLAAMTAFLVGRYLARGWVSRKVEGNNKFQSIDQAVAKEGWKIVLLTRLSPAFPFNLLNYGYGLTQISLKDYAWSSWLGMIPGTIMYVYIGSLAGDLATLGTNRVDKSLGEWIFSGVGFVATIVVTVYVTTVARRALNNKVEERET